MSLETEIQNLTQAVRDLIDTLNGTVVTPTDKPKRGGKVKDEPKHETVREDAEDMGESVDTATTAASSTETKTSAPASAEPKSSEIPYADVAKAINERCARGLNKAVKAVLLQYGANNGKELKPEQYAEFMATLKAEVA